MGKAEIRRQQEVELPATVDVVFINKNTDYQQGTQQAKRLAVQSQEAATVSLPIVMTDAQARLIAEKLLYAVWVARNKLSFKLGRKYTYLEPTDVITFVDAGSGATHVVRITRKTESRNGLIEFEGEAEDSSAYTQSATSGDASVDSNIEIAPGPTRAALLDIPLLRDYDDDYGFYAAACGYTDTWAGAVLFKSSDDGQTYDAVASLLDTADIGYATTTLGDWTGGNVFDEKNTVTIQLANADLTLESVSELSVLNGYNAALLNREIIQYKNATLNGDGTYTLSGLLRGRKGTEDFIADHQTGDMFVALSSNSLQRLSIGSSEIGATRLYKPVTLDTLLTDALAESFTVLGESLIPYAPVQISGGKQVNGDFLINWVRRARRSAEWMNGTDVPLGEDSESYEVLIVSNVVSVTAVTNGNPVKVTATGHGLTTGMTSHLVSLRGAKEINDKTFEVTVIDGNNYTIPYDGTNMSPYISGGQSARVRRTIAATSQTATYTAADQTTDFGSQQTSITYRIFQIGKIGRGRSARGTL